MEISTLVEKLEELLSSSTGVPATGKILIDREKLTDLVAQIRVAIPEDILEAHELLGMREGLISQAIQEARQIRNTSEQHAKSRVTESEITKDANKQSEEIIEEARRKAQNVLDETNTQATDRRSSADQYAHAPLIRLEEEICKILTTIRHGIELVDVEKETS